MNLNKLAVEISKREKGREEVSIAQIKEILRITLELLKQYPSWDVLQTIDRA